MEEIIIDVESYEEQEDGSAIVTLNLNEAGVNLLVQEGFISILRKQMEDLDEKDSCCGTNCTNVGCRC